MEGNVSKTRGRFDGKIPVTIVAYQGQGWLEKYISGQICESLDNQQQKIRVVEDLSGA